MKCRTCHYCQISQRNLGFCYADPPQVQVMRYYLIDGQEHIDNRPDKVIGLAPAGHQGVWPPVNPSESWCRHHRLSLFTWWHWQMAEEKDLPLIIKQDKPAGVNL
jgi:hypothetical protein